MVQMQEIERRGDESNARSDHHEYVDAEHEQPNVVLRRMQTTTDAEFAIDVLIFSQGMHWKWAEGS